MNDGEVQDGPVPRGGQAAPAPESPNGAESGSPSANGGRPVAAARSEEPLLTLKRIRPSSPAAGGAAAGKPVEEAALPDPQSYSEIRERVLARRQETLRAARRAAHESLAIDDSGSESEEFSDEEDEIAREAYGEFQKAKQVDLNDEEHAAKLEDQVLRGHMETARAGLRKQETALSRLPALEELRKRHLKTMQSLTGLHALVENDILMGARENGEMAHYQAKALGQVRAGRVPHGYPPEPVSRETKRDPNFVAALKKAREGAEAVATAYDETVKNVELAYKEIFRLRREIDAILDGMIRLYEASEETRRRQREYLSLVDQKRAAERSREAPAGLALNARELLPPSVRGVTSGAPSGAPSPATPLPALDEKGKGKEEAVAR